MSIEGDEQQVPVSPGYYNPRPQDVPAVARVVIEETQGWQGTPRSAARWPVHARGGLRTPGLGRAKRFYMNIWG
jgi:hypothetical protein